jgi:hypothetical protein
MNYEDNATNCLVWLPAIFDPLNQKRRCAVQPVMSAFGGHYSRQDHLEVIMPTGSDHVWVGKYCLSTKTRIAEDRLLLFRV